MTKTKNLIDDYISQFPESTQTKLEKIREIIKEAAPDATETIKYGIPTFVQNKNLVHFAGYKKHIGFYPTPSGIKTFEKELSPYKQSKGAVQFPLDKQIPFALIKKITQYRVEEDKKS